MTRGLSLFLLISNCCATACVTFTVVEQKAEESSCCSTRRLVFHRQWGNKLASRTLLPDPGIDPLRVFSTSQLFLRRSLTFRFACLFPPASAKTGTPSRLFSIPRGILGERKSRAFELFRPLGVIYIELLYYRQQPVACCFTASKQSSSRSKSWQRKNHVFIREVFLLIECIAQYHQASGGRAIEAHVAIAFDSLRSGVFTRETRHSGAKFGNNSGRSELWCAERCVRCFDWRFLLAL